MLNKRKKSNRLRPEKKARRSVQLPRLPLVSMQLPWRFLAVVSLAGLLCVSIWHLADQPVRSVVISAPFQRVSSMQIEDAVRQSIAAGLLSTDLKAVRAQLKQLPWVDEVRLRKHWPNEIMVGVTEQVAAARWGASGLLNTRGELFITDSRHEVKELPLLQGPDGAENTVAALYLQLHTTLLEYGFQLRTVTLDERGAWALQLSSGVEVRLGREQTEQRIGRFLELVTPLIAGRATLVDYIDMRYANGFAIGWMNDEVEQTSGDDKDA